MNTLEQESKEEKIQTALERIAFLELSDEAKANVASKISTEANGDMLYWLQLCLSVLIATFGLLQNSVAVVIGAMLIAPLLQPIQGMAFGVATGRPGIMLRSSKLLLISVAVAIGMGWLFTLLTPIRYETAEVLARTAPNLLDLLIALGSAVIAFLTLGYDRLSSSVGGVAMATALVPPLAVCGIAIAFGNASYSWGAFFLFFTNLFAIIIIGAVMFLLYGFTPHQGDLQKNTIRQFTVLCVLACIIFVPLLTSLLRISEAIALETKAGYFISEVLSGSIPEAKVEKIELLNHSRSRATFLGHIKLPEGLEFYTEAKDAIRAALSRELERDIDLQLEVLRVASIISKQDNGSTHESRIRNSVRIILKDAIPGVAIVKTEATNLTNNGGSTDWGITSLFVLPPDRTFTDESEIYLESEVKKLLPNYNLDFAWIPLPQQQGSKETNQLSEKDKYHQEVSFKWQQLLSETLAPYTGTVRLLTIGWKTEFPSIESEEFSTDSIKHYTISFDVELPESADLNEEEFESIIQTYAREHFEKPIVINYRIFRFLHSNVNVE